MIKEITKDEIDQVKQLVHQLNAKLLDLRHRCYKVNVHQFPNYTINVEIFEKLASL